MRISYKKISEVSLLPLALHNPYGQNGRTLKRKSATQMQIKELKSLYSSTKYIAIEFIYRRQLLPRNQKKLYCLLVIQNFNWKMSCMCSHILLNLRLYLAICAVMGPLWLAFDPLGYTIRLILFIVRCDGP